MQFYQEFTLQGLLDKTALGTDISSTSFRGVTLYQNVANSVLGGGGLAALEHPQKGGGQRGSRGDQKLTFPFCCKLISIPKVITSKNFRGLAVLQYPTKMRGRAKGSGGALKRGLQMHMTIIPLYICINTYVRMYIYMKNAYL